jgi:hypothetical protein
MLNRILSATDCAECKLCCNFYENELWEAPILAENISYDERGLYFCPELGEKGCKLGENEKPFDCRIYPFRVMKLGEFTVIALSPLCKKVNEKPLSELVSFADSELAPKVRGYSGQIKNYDKSYVIIKVL